MLQDPEVIAGSLFEQSGFSALKRKHAGLARSFDELRNQLDEAVDCGSSSTVEVLAAATEMEGYQRRQPDQQLARVLEKVRLQPGFERLLLSASEANVLEATRHGPIVILNISSYRRDALIVEIFGILLLGLSRLYPDAINDHAQDLGSLEVLGWLWDVIVFPVLEALGFTGHPSDGRWPHVWWVLTGILTQFPLHAAGHHVKRNGERAIDRVLSSYASSVKAIIHSRRRSPEVERPHRNADFSAGNTKRSLVAVGMEHTPKQKQLAFASEEINTVLAVC